MAKKRELRVYAREWRQVRGLTLEDAAPKVGLSVSYLSDLEKGSGGKRWNVDHLEALAGAYKLPSPLDLFRDPARQDPLLSLVEGLSGPERETAERVLSALHRTTKSDS